MRYGVFFSLALSWYNKIAVSAFVTSGLVVSIEWNIKFTQANRKVSCGSTNFIFRDRLRNDHVVHMVLNNLISQSQSVFCQHR